MKTKTHVLLRAGIFGELQKFYPFSLADFEIMWMATRSFDAIIKVAEYAVAAGYGDLWQAWLHSKRELEK